MAKQERSTGTVLWFNGVKGYGFIKPRDGGSDVFVHQTSVISEGFRGLTEGEEVEYSLSLEPGGKLSAIDVTGPNGTNVKGSTGNGQGTGSMAGRGGFGREWGGNRDRYGYRGMGRGSGGGCFTCGEVGHLSRECPHLRSCRDGSSSNGACFRCGGSGHMARHCNRSTNSSGQSCFNCGGLGHMARDCTSKRSKSYGGNGAGLGGPSYSCDKPGHTARDCTERRSSPGRPTTSCFHCGEMGHFARECPN